MDARNATLTAQHVPDWMQLLAAAIVQQALADAHDPSLPPAVRVEAQRFLSGNAEYRFWMRVAEGVADLPPIPSRVRRIGTA